MQVVALFNPRGGTSLTVTAEFRKDDSAPIETRF